ncbi:MAG: hypothetical protein DMG05_22850 [Acidobacteria bacterium]|nr:MAG: hypothetical protein DMG05_22850 [Acidobacteriota bacterium]
MNSSLSWVNPIPLTIQIEQGSFRMPDGGSLSFTVSNLQEDLVILEFVFKSMRLMPEATDGFGIRS